MSDALAVVTGAAQGIGAAVARRLAAQGLTNPDSARKLHVSVRTVGNHLHASYAKLGVHRREELAALHPFGAER